ncbi:hypothetical protein [Arthrobacter sp. 31Y]|uniref:hypothetical protein n=1 Tax=Arthrobacter sp. 31Y TaxID=1115632 RepID=UPI0005B92F8A|nr:hypothetical protein [Arthrobacter sp. 31Y]
MTFSETIDRLRTAYLMVRDANEWDGLTAALADAYHRQDDDLIEQLQPPFLQSWRTVTHYVLRDTLDAAGIAVTEPSHPWGIATLSANGVSREPVLCRVDPAVPQHAQGASIDGPELLTFAEIMAYYAECLSPLLEHASGHQEQYSR